MPDSHTEASNRVVAFKKGEILFDQHDTSRTLFVIKSGNVKIFKDEGGVTIDLETVGPGSVVGELSAIDGGPRSACVIAETNVEAYAIGEKEFSAVVEKIPDWFQRIAKILVHRLRDVDSKIDNSFGGDRSAQMSALIAMICRSKHARCIDGGTSELSIRFLENELADILTIQLSDVAEGLKRLAAQGHIKITKTHVVVTDVDKLEALGDSVFRKLDDSPSV